MDRDFHWQTAQIDDNTRFAYIDSGAPPGSTIYTTLVCVHGHTYHSKNFTRLLRAAPHYALRVIAVNRRDYIHSTPFSDAELAVLHGADAEQHKQFLQARGLEIACFLVWIIDELEIPTASQEGGGLALMGWSLGNITTLAFLRHLDSYPPGVLTKLSPYLTTFFIYESSYASTGHPAPPPPGGYHPLADTSIPDRVRGVMFGAWLASYFNHPFFAAGQEAMTERTLASLAQRAPPDEQAFRPPTNERIPPAALLASVDTVPGNRSESAYYGPVQAETLYDQFTGALILLDQGNPLPDLKVVDVYGTHSMWSVQWGIWETEKDLVRWSAEGRRVRPVSVVPVKGGNHFIHWDEPDQFLKLVKEGVKQGPDTGLNPQ